VCRYGIIVKSEFNFYLHFTDFRYVRTNTDATIFLMFHIIRIFLTSYFAP
jgi:hypothetical protein